MANIPNNFAPPNNVAPGHNFAPIAVGASVVGGFRALYIGTIGDIVVIGFDDIGATFVNAQSGSVLPMMGKAVGTTASGTSASNIVAIR